MSGDLVCVCAMKTDEDVRSCYNKVRGGIKTLPLETQGHLIWSVIGDACVSRCRGCKEDVINIIDDQIWNDPKGENPCVNVRNQMNTVLNTSKTIGNAS